MTRFFQGNLHCFTKFQRRKTTVMFLNKQFECKGITNHLFWNKIAKFVRLSWQEKGHLFNITWRRYTADHTACLWNQNGCPDTAIKGFWCPSRLSLVVNHKITFRLRKCVIKVRIHCLPYLNLAYFFTNYAIFIKLCDRMRFEVNCAKSNHRVIPNGLLYTTDVFSEVKGVSRLCRKGQWAILL